MSKVKENEKKKYLTVIKITLNGEIVTYLLIFKILYNTSAVLKQKMNP